MAESNVWDKFFCAGEASLTKKGGTAEKSNQSGCTRWFLDVRQMVAVARHCT